MSGLKNASAFETFDRMAGRIEQMEAEAEAHAELNEEATGDTLAHKFRELEVTKGADEDLTALKRQMGLLPPEPAPVQAAPVRVQAGAQDSLPLDAAEQDELARALADLDAEEQQQLRLKK
jgi:phage shock protein A